jgi:hypothetical protein
MGESDFRLFQLNEGMLEVLGVWRFWTFKKKATLLILPQERNFLATQQF